MFKHLLMLPGMKTTWRPVRLQGWQLSASPACLAPVLSRPCGSVVYRGLARNILRLDAAPRI